jgi:hypothetical protein
MCPLLRIAVHRVIYKARIRAPMKKTTSMGAK